MHIDLLYRLVSVLIRVCNKLYAKSIIGYP